MSVQAKTLTLKGKKGFKSSVLAAKKKPNVKGTKLDIPDTRSPVIENKAKVRSCPL